MTHQWHAPLDPDCPDVADYMQVLFDDPMTAYSGCADEIVAAFERRHRRTCARCQGYGAANIEIREGGAA